MGLREACPGGLACLLALAAAGCGGGGISKLEQRLKSELTAQLDRQQTQAQAQYGAQAATPTVARVDCPDNARTDPGSSFRCRALGPGGRSVGTLTVTMLDGGRPAWQFTAAGSP